MKVPTWALSASSQKLKSSESYLCTDGQWKLMIDVPVKILYLLAGCTTPMKKDS